MSAEFVPSVALAVDDFVPVVLSGVACFVLARFARARVPGVWGPALAGAAFIIIGGLAKATWKLIIALGGPDIDRLERLLFACLAPGFVLLVTALLGVWKERGLPLWPAWVAIGAAFTATSVTGSNGPLLVLAVIAATALGLLSIALALRAQDRTAAVLFAVQVLSAFALVPFAAPPQTEPKQWAEQSINTVGQLVFLLGALRLTRVVVERREDSAAITREAVA